MGVWSGFRWLTTGFSGTILYGSELLCYIKGRKIIHQLNDFQQFCRCQVIHGIN